MENFTVIASSNDSLVSTSTMMLETTVTIIDTDGK